MIIFLERLSSFIWGGGLIFLLLFTGAVYTIRLGFIQFKTLPYLIRNSEKENRSGGKGISQWKTVCMSLGTAMGTGNITGVASALALGGAGAVFWMWVSALLGMALVYAENSLSVIYSDSESKGPMAYLSKGLGSRFLSVFFAVMCLGAAFGMGGMIQVSSLTESINGCADINKYAAAAIIFVVIFIVTSGGAKRIGSAAQALLPLASIIYAAVCILLLIKFRESFSSAFSSIFSQAFGLRQVSGGSVGYAISVGIRRGIFSNEAGLGSSPILHSAAESDSPKLQGMWSMFEVFFDTIICCTLTALVILSASPDGTISGAFSRILGNYSDLFISFEMAIFAFCTVIGWYYCGETAYRFLTGKRSGRKFSLIFSLASSLGAILSLNTIWILSDIFNGLMAFPNLVGLFLLIKKVKKE